MPATRRHGALCRTHAIGCAVENLAAAYALCPRDPIEVGDEYLADGTATCYCDVAREEMTWAAPWIFLGIEALFVAGMAP